MADRPPMLLHRRLGRRTEATPDAVAVEFREEAQAYARNIVRTVFCPMYEAVQLSLSTGSAVHTADVRAGVRAIRPPDHDAAIALGLRRQ